MAISIFGTVATAATAASALTQTITVPTGTTTGHVCILAIGSTGAGTQTHAVSTEAGTWTSRLAMVSNAASFPECLSIWSLVPASSVGGTSITMTVGTSGSITGVLATFAGVDNTTPIDVAVPSASLNTVASATITMPGLTPVTLGAWYLGCAAWRSSASTASTATVLSGVDGQAADSRAGSTNVRSGASIQHLVWSSGAIASQTATLTTSTNTSTGGAVALRPSLSHPPRVISQAVTRASTW